MLKRLLLLSCLALLAIAGRAQAQTVILDGIEYTVNADGQVATVTGYTGEPVDVVIPATVNIEGMNYPVTAIGNEAFSGCYTLQNITLPEGLQSISEWAFSNCSALQSITLPGSLRTIDRFAFSYTSLQSITIPENVESIGTRAFQYCDALQSITCLGETPASLGDGVFYSLNLSTNYPDLNRYATEKLHVPQGAEAAYYAAKEWRYFAPKAEVDGVTYALDPYSHAAAVLFWPKDATSAAIPSAISYEGCTYTVDVIGIGAFRGCRNLQTVDIPQGVTHIGYQAFQYCPFQSINIPEGVAEIGLYAFGACPTLQSVTIPSTLQRIAIGAFDATYVEDVYSYAATPPAVYEGFTYNPFDEMTLYSGTLHVPANAVDDYQAAEYWKEFLNIEGDLPPVSIEDVATGASLATYANGILTTESPATITVYAQNGARVRHAADATSLSLSSLPRGMYIICVEQGGERQVMKVSW